jgi:TRAP-type C4-dicarboxylate transport system permease small subunit
MNELKKTAGILDKIFYALSIALTVGIVGCLVSLVIVAVGFLFKLDPSIIGTGYNTVELGILEFTVADGYAPKPWFVLSLLAIQITMTLVCLLIARPCIHGIRKILEPMTQGTVFHAGISATLRKLAKNSIFLCIAVNIMNLAEIVMCSFGFHIYDLLIGEKITELSIYANLDGTFLIVAGVLYLLSFVFHYGEELQQLSDETL